MNKIQRKILFVIAATASVGILSGCASTVMRPQNYRTSLTADTLPVCGSRPPLAQADAGKATGEALPVIPIKPQYPAPALFQGLNGVVALEFTIDTHGAPCDVALVYSTPDGVFVPAAVEALIHSKFKPKVVNGSPVDSRATFTYTFLLPANMRSNNKLHDVVVSPTNPAYPMAAWLDRVEGFVTFGFTVDTKGHPESIIVRQSEPAGVFDKAAARALRRSKFKIRYADGKAVPYNATFTYRFRLKPQSGDKAQQENKEGAPN